jgi:predicted transposase YbfD/YdcC
MLAIAVAIVTIDAMGCQTKIVEKIIDKQANYLIGLKGNQGQLNDDVRLLFENKPTRMSFITQNEIDKGHGRLEMRHCTLTDDIEWLREQHPQWKQLKSIIEIQSQREIKGEVALEKRYYISSLPAETETIQNAIRQHWGVENKLHWVLDICFNDDQSRIRKGHAPRKIAIIKKNSIEFIANN